MSQAPPQAQPPLSDNPPTGGPCITLVSCTDTSPPSSPRVNMGFKVGAVHLVGFRNGLYPSLECHRVVVLL